MTMVAVVFDARAQDDALTPQTKAEQFCESGRKLAPEMKTVALGYAAAGLKCDMFGEDMIKSAASEVETVPTEDGLVNVIETKHFAG